ncbi:hypothetical protein MKW98_027071 [Papaver atlanticum]|uniref:Uncharacterized protein n=1 Tax=Papaver atlanticum TaxID=357466 RepID=A0AAD4RWW8_9MAGN|nr:hypothetical protein MKW98_027071 [Papaver atlanticum]
MDFLSFMPMLIRRKFIPALVLLLLIPLISLGGFTSSYVSTNTEEKAKTEVNPHATTGLNFATAKINEIISYLKSFLNYASEEVVPVMKSFLYYTKEIVKKKIILDFNRCLNFTGENFLYSAEEKANKEVVPIVKSFLSSSNAKLNAEVIPYVQSCLNSTMGIVMEEVIPTVKSFLLSVKEKMNKEVIPTVKSFLLSMMEKINKEVIPCEVFVCSS